MKNEIKNTQKNKDWNKKGSEKMGTVFLWTMGGMVMLSQAVTEDLHGGVLVGVLGSVKSGALG